jgi:DNA-binding NarL/FixJ family response regulator
MRSKLRVLIADDHAIVRDGVRSILESEPDIEVVGEAGDGRELIRLSMELKPDVVLSDVSMPLMTGCEAIRQLSKRLPETRSIILSVHKIDPYVHDALGAGAYGYLIKDDSRTDVLNAVRTVGAGKKYLTPSVCANVVNGYLDKGDGQEEAPKTLQHLTGRERQVSKLIADGHKNREMAEILSLSPKTIEKHRANLMRKLGLRTAASLTAYAIQNGLSSVDNNCSQTAPRLVDRDEFDKLLSRYLAERGRNARCSSLCFVGLETDANNEESPGAAMLDSLSEPLANFVLRQVRSRDVLGRIGSREFGLLIDNCKPAESGRVVDHIADAVNSCGALRDARSAGVRLKIGLAPIGGHSSVQALIDATKEDAQRRGLGAERTLTRDTEDASSRL